LTADVSNTFAAAGLCLAIAGVNSSVSVDDIRIFWGDSRIDQDEASSLMYRLAPVATLTQDSASKFIPEISTLCRRMEKERTYIYLLRPPGTWGRHLFAADILKPNSSLPAEQIASPRSQVIAVQIAPLPGPELIFKAGASSSGKKTWTVATAGLFPQTVPGYLPCQVQLELFDKDSQVLKTFEPTPFGTFASAGFSSDDPKIHAGYKEDQHTIEIEYLGAADDVAMRLTATDPAARPCSLTLR
jgi:hypothetical protein